MATEPELGKRVKLDPRRQTIGSVREMLYKLRPPGRLDANTAEAMLADPTIAICLRARWAIALSSDWQLDCEDEDLRALGQKIVDAHVWRILPHALLAQIYGEAAVQIQWGVRSLAVSVAKPSGVRNVRLPKVYWPEAYRALEPSSYTSQIDAMGDYAGVTYRTELWPPELVALFVHQQRFGRLYGISALLPQWRPWQVEFRVFDDLSIHMQGRASPPLLGRAPDARDWRMSADDDMSATGIEDPMAWLRDVAANVYSNGGVILPSAKREAKETGADLGYLFDLQQLEMAAAGDEYERILLYLRMLKIEGGFSTVTDGQASAKQAARQFHGMVYPDQLELASQIHDQIIRPIIVLAAEGRFPARELPETRLVPGKPAENRHELMLEMLRTFRDARVRLEDGKEIPMANLIDAERILRQLSVPTIDPDAAAGSVAPAAATPDMALPEGRPRVAPGAKIFDSDEPPGLGGPDDA